MKTQNEIVRKLLGLLKALAIPVMVYLLFGVLSGGRMFRPPLLHAGLSGRRMVNTRTLLTVLRQAIQPAIICYALLLGMKIGMMNFGAGSIVVCAAIMGSGISSTLGLGLPGFILFAVLISLACSAILGLLYNLLRVPCMVLSLGMMLVFEAVPRMFFSGGAIIGAGLILYLNAFGFEKTERFFTAKTYKWVSFSALSFYCIAKSYSFYTGAHHLESGIPLGTAGNILSSGLILPLNICVGLVVACTMYAFFALFRKGGF